MATALARKPKQSDTATITEYVDSRGSDVKVNREQNLIEGVRVLGLNSQNPRDYSRDAAKQAISLYEGAAVYVNHPSGNLKAPRNYQDRIGKLENVTQASDGGLTGNLRYNPKHPLAEQMAWDAENKTKGVGLSHVAECKMGAKQNGRERIESIVKVYSCDLVCSPATTTSLSESTEDDMALETLTLEQLKTQRPDLLTALVQEQSEGEAAKTKDAELKALKEQLDAFQAKDRIAAKQANVEKLVAEAKLPKEALSPVFLESLMGADDDAKIKALIADRKAFVGAGKPISKDLTMATESASGAKDCESFVRSITSRHRSA